MTDLPKFPSCRNCFKLQCYLKPTNEGEKRTEPLRWSECVLNLDYEEQCLKNKWRSEFVASLEAEQLPRILDAMVELIDDRSDFQKGYKKGYVDAYQRVLEAFKSE